MNWPNDADGDVLRRLEKNDFNFDKEVVIDFNHWPLLNEEKQEIIKLFSNCEILEPDEEDIENGDTIGYVKFQIKSKLTYELIINTQNKITNNVKKYGGLCESWGVMQEELTEEEIRKEAKELNDDMLLDTALKALFYSSVAYGITYFFPTQTWIWYLVAALLFINIGCIVYGKIITAMYLPTEETDEE